MDHGFLYAHETSRSQSKSPKNTNVCVICTEVSNGQHFGIYACRACTAFFRRTVVLNKRYVCRKGGDNCPIHKSIGRAMCRKCRYRKCIDLGMREEMVQRRRDPIGRKTFEEGSSSVTSGSNTTESSPESFATSSMEGSRTPNELPEIILRTQSNYHDHCRQQRIKEIALKQQSPNKVFPGCALLPDMNRITCRFLYQMSRALRGSLRQFLALTFSEYNLLTEEEQTIVAAHCISVMWVMDSAYRTYCRLPKKEFKRKCLYTHTTYVDEEQLEEFVSDIPKSNVNRTNMIDVTRSSFSGERNRVVSEMHEIHLTEPEYCALVALTVWNSNMRHITSDIEQTAKTIRRRIFRELDTLYRNNGSNDFTQRMCEVLHLIQTVENAERRLYLDIELYNLCDAFTEDNDIIIPGTFLQVEKCKKVEV